MARFQTKSRLEDLADVNLIGIGAYKFLILDVRDIKRARHKKILYADRCELSMPRPYFEDILQGYIKHHLPENMIVRDTKRRRKAMARRHQDCGVWRKPCIRRC